MALFRQWMIIFNLDDIVESMMRKVLGISLFEISYRFWDMSLLLIQVEGIFVLDSLKNSKLYPKCRDKLETKIYLASWQDSFINLQEVGTP
jgi:hypothetical protein